MKYAPILIPTLCRADKFKRCIESLKKNKWARYTTVYVALDYPLKDTHWNGYNEICEYLNHDFTEFAEFHIIKRKTNYGSSKNIEEARDLIFQNFDRYIYTDDDIEFSENFLEYIDKTMELYEKNPDVIAVCGYSYPLQWNVSQGSTTFLTTTGLFMWGTGFWRDKYIPIKESIEEGIFRKEYATRNNSFWRKKLIDARYIDFLGLGTSEDKGLLDCSSDISLSTYMELYDKYAVIPVISKARNYGFDGSGVYCQKINKFSFNAGQYDYSSQEIDKQNSFYLVPDTLCDDASNRKLWAEFDCRKNIGTEILLREWKCYLRKLLGKDNYKKIKFVIVSTRQRWGGAVALHALCKNLEDLGYNASIYYVNDGEAYSKGYFWIKHILFKLTDHIKCTCVKICGEHILVKHSAFSGYVNISIKGCREKYFPWVDSKTIVVYPDVVYGNFLRAQNTVRWLLYYNRYGDDAYGTNDLFYAYRNVFNDIKKNPQNRVLTVAHFNLDLYKRTNLGNRSGSCYVIRKGSNRSDLPKKFDGPVIDNLTEQDKVKVLNESKYCISYDTQTAYSAIAAICGCISIVVPEEGKTWKDYRNTKEECYGVAFGNSEEQILWAKETTSKALERYQALNANGLKETEKFAKEAIKYFGMDR